MIFETVERETRDATTYTYGPAFFFCLDGRRDRRVYPDRLSVVRMVRFARFDHFQGHPRDLLGVNRAELVQARRHAVGVANCLYLKTEKYDG